MRNPPRTPALVALSLMLLLALGCHSTPDRGDQYPAFYSGWNPVPEELRADLDQTRESLIDGDSDSLITYAQVTGQPARLEATRWLDAAARGKSGATRNQRVSAARQRVLASCTASLALFRQHELEGNPLDWRSSVEMAWLLVLMGSDVEANQRLIQVLDDPAVPDSVRQDIEEMLTVIDDLPAEDELP